MTKLTSHIMNELPQFVFSKDKYGRYTGCNENFAEAAGLDSPQSILSKSDYDLVWKKQADVFQLGDRQTMRGQPLCMAPEILTRFDGHETQVLTWKSVVRDQSNKVIGMTGIAIEITGYHVIKKIGEWNTKEKVLHLEGYNDLTRRETQVLYYILKQKTARQAAEKLFISPSTVESHIEKIRYKLECNSKKEIISRCIQSGLVWLFFENSDWLLKKKP